MDRLVTFGCSNTYGQGLKDCHWTDNRSARKIKMASPSKLAWPNLLAKKLGIECCNESVPGASNKLIMHKVISFPILPTDTVVVMWSYADRFAIIKNDPSKDFFYHKRIAPWEKDKSSKNYYKFIYNEYDHNIMTDHYINYVGLYLEKHNITNIHTTCCYKTQHPLVLDIKHDQLRRQYPKGLDGIHPGPETHKEIANRIYKRMTV